jgi:septum formation protein
MVFVTKRAFMQPILLSSSSPYRRELLGRLGLTFEWSSPNIDESPLPDESADALVARLSIAKAKAVASANPQHLIIGSDQVAVLDDQIIGKPHTHENAVKQLRAVSGRKVIFKTGLCLLDACTGESQVSVEEFTVYFRELSDEQIHHYLTYEQPYDCAGSFKCEGLGIALFSKLTGDDPNTLVGLPLIRLVDMLQHAGIDPLLLAKQTIS